MKKKGQRVGCDPGTAGANSGGLRGDRRGRSSSGGWRPGAAEGELRQAAGCPWRNEGTRSGWHDDGARAGWPGAVETDARVTTACGRGGVTTVRGRGGRVRARRARVKTACGRGGATMARGGRRAARGADGAARRRMVYTRRAADGAARGVEGDVRRTGLCGGCGCEDRSRSDTSVENGERDYLGLRCSRCSEGYNILSAAATGHAFALASSTGYLSDENSTPGSSLRQFDEVSGFHDQNPPEVDKAKIVDNLIRRFRPSISKDVGHSPKGANVDSYVDHSGHNVDSENLNSPESKSSSEADAGGSTSKAVKQEPLPSPTKSMRNPVQRLRSKGLVEGGDETEKPCQLELGSYCLWSVEHKEEMKDSMVKKLKDQLFVARSYFPTITKLQSQEQFSRELKQNIQDHERMLSEAVVDADLPLHVGDKIQKMEETIARAKTFPVECSNVDKKLRQILDLTEDEAHFHMRQSAFLYHLGVQTMPKSLHCLSMRLTVEYFLSPSLDKEHAHLEKLVNPALQHYVIFSKNILASSVAVNSTVMNCKESGNLVFHLLTDTENYFSMKFWFSRNVYKDAVIHVQDIEDYLLENVDKLGIYPYLSFSEEFRISIRSVDQPSSVHTRIEYVSVFSHAYFLLPDLFKELKRIVVLDDDVVVQDDLSPLWNLDLKGKVNGAVEFCEVQLSHMKSYFSEKNYEKDMCLWISGLSVVDLDMWRDLNVTGTYQQLLHEHMRPQKRTQTSLRTAAVTTSILAFRDHVFALNGSWVLSGLGTNYGVDADAIKNAAVLHYNGNMKPWLELGIPHYKTYWRNFLTKHDLFMDECNVNP